MTRGVAVVRRVAVLCALPALLAPAPPPGGLPAGESAVEVPFGPGKLPVKVYVYKPSTYRGTKLLIVCHGLARNAEEYRGFARGLADRTGALVAAPEFDEERFPYWQYTRGGVLDRDARLVADRSRWTWTHVPALVREVCRREAKPDLAVSFIGHSAGGQFVGRMPALVPAGAKRYVAANPGAYLFPTRDLPFPYGFGGLPRELASEDALRAYLAQPLTVFVGSADNVPDPDLDQSEPARAQGKSRLERGRRMVRAGVDLARERGWECRWLLVEAPGVGHDAGSMFGSPAAIDALGDAP